MKIKITMIVEVADDNEVFTTEDNVAMFNVAMFIENKIDGEEGLEVIECDGREIHD